MNLGCLKWINFAEFCDILVSMIDKHKLESFSFVGLFVLVSVLVFFIFEPFFQILTLAIAFAIIFHSPYENLAKNLGRRPNTAATFVVIACLVFFIVPIFILASQIVQEAQALYLGMQDNQTNYIQVISHAINIPAQQIFPNYTFNASEYIANILSFMSDNLGVFVSRALYIFFETFLMLLASFFFLRDGRKMIAVFKKVSPFGTEHTIEFLDKMYATINSVIKGTLFTALIRWVLVSVAFYLVGIPHALLWGSIAGLVGAVPGLGTPVSIIPAVGYLFFIGNVVSAFGLLFFGILLIICVDNLLTAHFFGEGFDIPSIFVLFSILGGVIFFGPLGFILGPLVLSVFLSVIHTYSTLKA